MDTIKWVVSNLSSPNLSHPVPTVAALDLPYLQSYNLRQVLNIYLRVTQTTEALIDTRIDILPKTDFERQKPRTLVYIHGGAWRDPFLRQNAIEATVAHAFADESSESVDTVISIDYTLSPFPTHPTAPYDPSSTDQRDLSREARHPDHVKDIFRAFSVLRKMGLEDGQFVLVGHSAGSWLVFSSTLRSPSFYGFNEADVPAAPIPAALLGLNGLYDMKGLVYDLGPTHQHLDAVYKNLIGIALGSDENTWDDSSPGNADVQDILLRLRSGRISSIIMLDQSPEDQLVPMNQTDNFIERLGQVEGLTVKRGNRCTGRHAAPWEEGNMLWAAVKDLLTALP